MTVKEELFLEKTMLVARRLVMTDSCICYSNLVNELLLIYLPWLVKVYKNVSNNVMVFYNLHVVLISSLSTL